MSSSLPSATSITEPSGSLRTQPVMGKPRAKSFAVARKPTPWTMPRNETWYRMGAVYRAAGCPVSQAGSMRTVRVVAVSFVPTVQGSAFGETTAMRSLAVSCVLTLCAPTCVGAPAFLSLEYTGNAHVAGVQYTNISITVLAKGLTTDVVTTPTAQGTRHTMPVGMTIHLEGFNPFDISLNMRFFSFSEAGVVGFEEIGESQHTFIAIAPELAGFDLRSSIGPTPLLSGAGNPPMIIPTAVGLLSLGSMQSGTFTASVFNPAPGSGVILAMGLALPGIARRRPRTSG